MSDDDDAAHLDEPVRRVSGCRKPPEKCSFAHLLPFSMRLTRTGDLKIAAKCETVREPWKVCPACGQLQLTGCNASV